MTEKESTQPSADSDDVVALRGFSPEQRAGALIEALPYIQRFRRAIIVVKLGGNAMVDPDLFRTFAEDIVLLRSVGLQPVVVHGGGPQIGALLKRLGKESEYRQRSAAAIRSRRDARRCQDGAGGQGRP